MQRDVGLLQGGAHGIKQEQNWNQINLHTDNQSNLCTQIDDRVELVEDVDLAVVRGLLLTLFYWQWLPSIYQNANLEPTSVLQLPTSTNANYVICIQTTIHVLTSRKQNNQCAAVDDVRSSGCHQVNNPL